MTRRGTSAVAERFKRHARTDGRVPEQRFISRPVCDAGEVSDGFDDLANQSGVRSPRVEVERLTVER